MEDLKLCQRCQAPLVEAPVEYLKASANFLFPNMRPPRKCSRSKEWVSVCQSCDVADLTFDFNASMPLRLPSGEIIESAPHYRRWPLDQPKNDNA